MSSICNKESEGGLSEDLLMEILVRLPYKSLSKFKCVSKSWCRLISDDYLRQRLPLITSGVFFRSESDANKEPRYAYTSNDSSIIEDYSLYFFPFQEKSTLVDSCNGLLLYYTSSPTNFFVVNPTAKKWKALPRFHKKTLLSILAFDPYSSQNYKVICFTAWRAQGAEVEIFSSETDKWVQHELQFGLETDTMSATIHYFNGILYILAYPNVTVAINLNKMASNLVRLPEPMNRDARIGHSHGRIHYSHFEGNQLKIWMLKDMNRSEWVLKHGIGVREMVGEGNINPKEVHVLAFHPERDLVYAWVPWRMVSFDLAKRRVERNWEFEKESDKAYLIQIWLFPFSRHLLNCLA